MHVRMDQNHWSIAKSIQRITAFTWAARVTALITTTARTMIVKLSQIYAAHSQSNAITDIMVQSNFFKT